ncbi:MAG: class I SAM-dependent methyltransferase [Candidatus Omnitrophica bacterium]|nr:class I SAM-dependent methyltransferase [Candidatus Omnitrophota bacterium]
MNKEILENYNKYLERKALFKSFGYDVDSEREFILSQAQPFSGRILEAGTGKGHFTLALAKAGYCFTTFDISEQEQGFAKLIIEHFGFKNQVDFRIENAESTSFAAESFDVVFSVNVLHHLLNPCRVLDEFIRIISPRGKLILADFTDEGFRVMDQIHGLEGNKHGMGEISLNAARSYLLKKGLLAEKTSSTHQSVLLASKC